MAGCSEPQPSHAAHAPCVNQHLMFTLLRKGWTASCLWHWTPASDINREMPNTNLKKIQIQTIANVWGHVRLYWNTVVLCPSAHDVPYCVWQAIFHRPQTTDSQVYHRDYCQFPWLLPFQDFVFWPESKLLPLIKWPSSRFAFSLNSVVNIYWAVQWLLCLWCVSEQELWVNSEPISFSVFALFSIVSVNEVTLSVDCSLLKFVPLCPHEEWLR